MNSQNATQVPVSLSTGNIFSDLGLDGESELQVKAELTRQIYHRIRVLKLTQIQAAKQLEISQPDVSKLMNGRYTGYSTDRLLELLNALKIDVEIVLRTIKGKSTRQRGRVTVSKIAA